MISLILFIVFANLLSYSIMWYDKKQAIKGKQRIAENTLFILALFFGAIGIYIAMQAPLYHKKNKWKFKIGIPLCIILNVFCLFYILHYCYPHF